MVEEPKKTEYETFLHNVAWLRRHHGLSKKRMAQLMGIGTGSLTKIENGEFPQHLGVNVFFNVQRHFGVPPAVQLGRCLGEEITGKDQ